MDKSVHNYIDVKHPCQQRVAQAVADMCDTDSSTMSAGIDGCGIPAAAMPLSKLALGMARFAEPKLLSAQRATAIRKLQLAIASYPVMVDGPGRFATDIIAASNGTILAKSGAEGVFVASVPDAGLGVAVKILDGSARAASVALGGILAELGLLSKAGKQQLAEHLEPTIINCNNATVGKIRYVA